MKVRSSSSRDTGLRMPRVHCFFFQVSPSLPLTISSAQQLPNLDVRAASLPISDDDKGVISEYRRKSSCHYTVECQWWYQAPRCRLSGAQPHKNKSRHIKRIYAMCLQPSPAPPPCPSPYHFTDAAAGPSLTHWGSLSVIPSQLITHTPNSFVTNRVKNHFKVLPLSWKSCAATHKTYRFSRCRNVIDTESDRHGSCPTKPNLTASEIPKSSTSFPIEHFPPSPTFGSLHTTKSIVHTVLKKMEFSTYRFLC